MCITRRSFRSLFGFWGVGWNTQDFLLVFSLTLIPLAASGVPAKKIVLGSSEETLAKHLPSTFTFSGWETSCSGAGNVSFPGGGDVGKCNMWQWESPCFPLGPVKGLGVWKYLVWLIRRAITRTVALTSPDKSVRGMSPWGIQSRRTPGEGGIPWDNVMIGKIRGLYPLLFCSVQFILTDFLLV